MLKKRIVPLDLGPEDVRKLEFLMERYGLDAQQTLEKCIEEAAADLRRKDREAGRAEE
jgi:hypothetical protein